MILKLILRPLKSFLHLLDFFKKLFKKENKIELLPVEISDEEKIVRSIFSPVNFYNDGRLRSNSFKTPTEKDEVSVNRLDFTTPTFCKEFSKKIEQPENKRSYFGFAVLTAKEIRDTDSEVVYSPVLENADFINIYHSDIKIGCAREKGEQLPARYQLKVDELTKKARLYLDPKPDSLKWEGEELV